MQKGNSIVSEKLPRAATINMPLISSLAPSAEGQRGAVQVRDQEVVKQQRELDFQNLEEIDDQFMDSDMEGSILNRPRPKKSYTAPILPQRSEKRASRIFESSVRIETKSLHDFVPEAEEESDAMDPHELYLSSEEDASFSDFDDADSLMDFEASPMEENENQSAPSSRGSTRRSQEDTARVVSFITVGKPQIVEVHSSPPRNALRIDTTNTLPEARRPSPLRLYPSALRRLSITSMTSLNSHRSSTMPSTQEPTNSPNTLPIRKSSRMASIVTSTKHAFLQSDPFESDSNMQSSQENTPVTPKTPISMAAAAWKTGFNRTLLKARKPSMPKLSLSYTAGVVTPRTQSKMNLAAEVEDEVTELDPWRQRQRAATTPQTEHDGPMRYQDIMAQASQSDVKERKYSLGMRGLSRRKSVRGKDRFLG